MKRVILPISLLTALSACAAQPIPVVRAIYGERDLATVGVQADRYFARDLAAALAADPYAPGFDYRYDRGDAPRGVRLAETRGEDIARVFARYDRGRSEVVWSLCRGADGQWRISDAGSAGRDYWTLREQLDLPAKIEC